MQPSDATVNKSHKVLPSRGCRPMSVTVCHRRPSEGSATLHGVVEEGQSKEVQGRDRNRGSGVVPLVRMVVLKMVVPVAVVGLEG